MMPLARRLRSCIAACGERGELTGRSVTWFSSKCSRRWWRSSSWRPQQVYPWQNDASKDGRRSAVSDLTEEGAKWELKDVGVCWSNMELFGITTTSALPLEGCHLDSTHSMIISRNEPGVPLKPYSRRGKDVAMAMVDGCAGGALMYMGAGMLAKAATMQG
jgi:hypothetical protein